MDFFLIIISILSRKSIILLIKNYVPVREVFFFSKYCLLDVATLLIRDGVNSKVGVELTVSADEKKFWLYIYFLEFLTINFEEFTSFTMIITEVTFKLY